jgi:glycosyltransferase involved in cell wall biosynthesis
MRRQVFGAVAGAIAGTPAAARVLRETGYIGRLAVVPQFGVDLERFRPDPAARLRTRAAMGIPDARFLVGFGGRLVREKGVHLLVRAIAGIPSAVLAIAGEGPERERLRALARALGVADRVHFSGRRPSTVMPDWLNALDLLALPSQGARGWSEQFGRILVEAMACGVPVVASRSGEIPDVVADAGILVPEGDAEALGAGIASLATDELARHRLACAGRARVMERFTQTRIADDTLAFYRELLAGRAE